MLEKHTFKTDAEVNSFFQNNKDAYLIKLIVCGGEQHLVISRGNNGRDHLPANTPISR
jgi:hypothetical protein